jgi:hypothetical protein
MKPIKCLCTLAICLLSGCATTTVETIGIPFAAPFCQSASSQSSVSILWAPHWRSDQKEPALREAAALKGIEGFFSTQPCIDSFSTHRIPLPENYEALSEAQLLAIAKEAGDDAPQRVILIVIRELGPLLRIGLPTIIEGGTEVVLEIQAMDLKAAFAPVNLKTHWQHGGPFYIKGVDTLDEDMASALSTVFVTPAAPE